MEIEVTHERKWGKDLFYPKSKDAFFLTKFTGRPTLLVEQLRLAKSRGWKVKICENTRDLEDFLR